METAVPSEAPAPDTDETGETGEPCIICKEPLTLDGLDDALALQCGHAYHAACLNAWWAVSGAQRCAACTREATAYRHVCAAAAAAATLLRPGHGLAAPRPCAPCGHQRALLLRPVPARRPGDGDDDDDGDDENDENDENAVLARLARLAGALRATRAAGAPLRGLLDPAQRRSYDALLALLARPDCPPAALVAYLDDEGDAPEPPGPGDAAPPVPPPPPASPPPPARAAHTANATKTVFAMMYSWLPGRRKEAGDLRLVAEVKPPAAPDGGPGPAPPPAWVRDLCDRYRQRARVLRDWQAEYRDPAAGTDVYFELLCAFEAFWSVVQTLKAAARGEDRRAELELDLARRLASLMWVKETGWADPTGEAAAQAACPSSGRDQWHRSV